MNEEIIKLEMKIAYLEDFLNELNTVVMEQGKKIDALIKVNKELKQKVEILEENHGEGIPNTPPPHY